MKTNYLLIDFENVQPGNLALLHGTAFKVIVFLGTNQSKIPLKFAQELQKFGSDAQYIQASGNGSNALDFHIAFTIGELSISDPDAYFHVISKDTGFDPLIRYAKEKGLFVVRSKEISEIPVLKLSNAKTRDEKVAAIVHNLASRGGSRPRRVATLSSTINALFQKCLSQLELAELVESLDEYGHISIEGNNIAYHFNATHQA